MSKKVYDNRELSWLKFNERVMEEANDKATPIGERLSFSSIFSSNLDEFFMVRVGSLHDKMLIDDNDRDGKTLMCPSEQIDAVLARVKTLSQLQDKSFERICSSLEENGIKKIKPEKASKDDKEFIDKFFKHEVSPFLSPLVVDSRHPFPFLNGKSIYAAAGLKSKGGTLLGIVSTSGVFKRVIILPPTDKHTIRYMLAEDLILSKIHKLFPDYEVCSKALLRVTRNADIDVNEALYDHELDFRSIMSELIKKRKKLCAVRLQLSAPLDDDSIGVLKKKLDIHKSQIFIQSSPLDMSFTGDLLDIIRDKKMSELFYEPHTPQKSIMVNDNLPMISQIDKRDIFLSYPYESIKPFIRLLKEAAADESVVSIKITLYRVAKNSQIIDALIDAAENGKDVLVLVELRARFDEENNIGWSKRLEESGVKVIYGPEELKVHSKLLLITRKAGTGIKYTTQIGTGNYNEKTSALYTDVSLMTANENIAKEAAEVFNCLSTGCLVEESNYLLVSPLTLRQSIVKMMDKEILKAKNGEDAFVGAKLNSLTDKVLINKLIECSKAGVKVQLVVRGICCLIPGISGITDNITVVSIVGRYLEHARFYIFGADDDSRRVYISSADFMTRNTIRRVEVAAPIYDKEIKARIIDMFNTMMSDNIKARVLGSDGIYIKRTPDGEDVIHAQEYFYHEAVTKARLKESSDAQAPKLGFFQKIINLFKRKK